MKKIIALFITFMLLSALVACGDAEPASVVNTPSIGAETSGDTKSNKVAVWIVKGIVDTCEESLTGALTYDEAYNLEELTITGVMDGETLTVEKGYDFDKSGRVIKETLKYPGEETEYTTYLYDEYGNEINENYSYTYDEAGRILTSKNKNGDITTYTYDETGRTLSEVTVFIDGSTYERIYTYTDNGRRLTITDGRNVPTIICYDDQGREISCENSVYPTRTEYDENGNISRIIMTWCEDSAGVEYTYEKVYVTAEQAEIIRQQQEVLKNFMILWG